jgi:hypothetical protein
MKYSTFVNNIVIRCFDGHSCESTGPNVKPCRVTRLIALSNLGPAGSDGMSHPSSASPDLSGRQDWG